MAKQTINSERRRYGAGNLQAAEIIASNPAKYPPESLAARWAQLVMTRASEAGQKAAA